LRPATFRRSPSNSPIWDNSDSGRGKRPRRRCHSPCPRCASEPRLSLGTAIVPVHARRALLAQPRQLWHRRRPSGYSGTRRVSPAIVEGWNEHRVSRSARAGPRHRALSTDARSRASASRRGFASASYPIPTAIGDRRAAAGRCCACRAGRRRCRAHSSGRRRSRVARTCRARAVAVPVIAWVTVCVVDGRHETDRALATRAAASVAIFDAHLQPIPPRTRTGRAARSHGTNIDDTPEQLIRDLVVMDRPTNASATRPLVDAGVTTLLTRCYRFPAPRGPLGPGVGDLRETSGSSRVASELMDARYP